MDKSEPVWSTPGHDALHLWFELSYASYLTLPRVVLNSMPDEWQGKLAALLNELGEVADSKGLRWPPEDCGIEVRLRDASGRYRRDDMADYQRGRRRLWKA